MVKAQDWISQEVWVLGSRLGGGGGGGGLNVESFG